MKFSAALAIGIAATGALAAPTNIEVPKDLIWPSNTYRFWVQSKEVIQDPQNQLLVVRNDNLNDETTTIVTFAPRPDLEGRTCRLRFDLWDRDVSTGSHKADVFSWVGVPVGTFSVANLAVNRPAYRDEHKGRITLPKPGMAEWIQSYDGYPEFPCPQELMAVEFVSVGDKLELRWDIGVTGPRIEILK